MSRYVIAAAPRSGTAFTAQLLTDLGLACGHERYFSLQTHPQPLAENDGTLGDSSWLAVPFLQQLPPHVRIVHQVRNPLNVVRSLLEIAFLDLDQAGRSRRHGRRRQFTEFALQHSPCLREYATELERAAWFYYDWNQRIERSLPSDQIFRVRLEDLDVGTLRQLLAHIAPEGMSWTDERLQSALNSLPHNLNNKLDEKVILVEDVTWTRLPGEICELARAYGYPVEEQLASARLPTAPGDASAAPSPVGNDVALLSAQLVDLRRSLRDAQLKLQGAEGDVHRIQREARAAYLDREQKLRARIERLAIRTRRIAERRERLLERYRELRNSRRDLAARLAAVRRELARQESANAELRESLETSLRRANDTATLNAQLDAAQQALHDLARRAERDAARAAKLQQQFDRTKAANAQSRARLDYVRGRSDRLAAQNAYYRAEFQRRNSEIRFRLGDTLIRAMRPSLDTLLVPARLVTLFIEGLRRRRLRRRASRDVTPAPTAATPPVATRPATDVLPGPAAPRSLPPAEPPRATPTLPLLETPHSPGGNGVPLPSPDNALTPAAPRAVRDARGFLFFCVNGAGLGHLTRALAIARRIRRLDPAIPVTFLSSSQALAAIAREGIITHHIPSRSICGPDVGAREWNQLLLAQLRAIVELHQPAVLVYDGISPYAGLVKVIAELPFRHTAMVLRLRHKHDRLGEMAAKLAIFNQLIFPGEAGVAIPAGLAGLRSRVCDPIIYLDPEETLPRDVVRQQWHIPPDKKAVYVQLGAGNINDIAPWVERILDVLLARDDLQVVLAESPIAEQLHAARPGVRILAHYPNSLYFNAFDLAITAAGYNTFHELMHFGVPTVLIPNQETRTDDQVARAQSAESVGAALVVLHPAQLADAITAALRDDVAATLRENARRLVPLNGAIDVARTLLALAAPPVAAPPATARELCPAAEPVS